MTTYDEKVLIGYIKASTIDSMSKNIGLIIIGVISKIGLCLNNVTKVTNYVKIDSPKFQLGSSDNIVLYYDNNDNSYKLGKWNNNTLTNRYDYKVHKNCNLITELVRKLEDIFYKHNPKTNDAHKLQTTETDNRKPVERKGNTIEVKGSFVTVEARPVSNGTIISC